MSQHPDRSDDADMAATAAAVARRVADRGGEWTVSDVADGASSLRAALETIGGVWPMMVLTALGDGPLRYGELKTVVVGINDRMLSQTLQRLVRDGLAARTVVESRRSCVEYDLTDLGREVRTALTAFISTVMTLAPEVARAREQSDNE